MPAEESTKESTDSTVETLNTVNLKTVAEAAAHSIALAYENAVAHQGAMNMIREAAIGSIVKNLTEVDATARWRARRTSLDKSLKARHHLRAVPKIRSRQQLEDQARVETGKRACFDVSARRLPTAFRRVPGPAPLGDRVCP